jgi:hypothetical protein
MTMMRHLRHAMGEAIAGLMNHFSDTDGRRSRRRSAQRGTKAARQPWRASLHLEALEDRALPALTVSITPVAAPISTPVDHLTITFSQPVTGFDVGDLQLSRPGGPNLLSPAQTLSSNDGITFTLGNLAGLTDPTHRVADFTLRLNAAGSGILDAMNNPLATGASTSFVEVDPTLTLQGTTLTVPGTAGDDTFSFTAGNAGGASFVLDGASYAIDAGVVSTVGFQGNGGTDTANLTGQAHSNAVLTPASRSGVLFVGAYDVQASAVATLNVTGGGIATVYDTPGADAFVATPTYAFQSGTGYRDQLNGFGQVTAVSFYGGDDIAYLYGNDTFIATPSTASLIGTGYFNSVDGFRAVTAISAGGGAAYLYDSAGNDVFIATPTYAYLSGAGFVNEAYGFRGVTAVSVAGGQDSAFLYDSGGPDVFVGAPTYAYLSGAGYLNLADGFSGVTAFSNGTSVAYLYDSAGDDLYVATPTYAYLCGVGFCNQVNGFKGVTAFSTGGKDVCDLTGSGGTDSFVGTPSYCYLHGSGFYNQANGFSQVLADGLGFAVASLFDTGNDQFTTDGDGGSLTSPDCSVTVDDFPQVAFDSPDPTPDSTTTDFGDYSSDPTSDAFDF